ncbi:J domain-containing protein [Synechococcus sp. CB0101]|nr:DnaJ domain-containing protein [Synechococcus sp. CB0101]QCH13973.1 J domain-containing protein [Synechococcus sp. CB0101]
MSSAPSRTTVNHWSVLGLDPGADSQALKRAFRQQARRWHPDLNGNDPHAEEQFKAVNEAYAVLSDPQRRQQWEQGLDTADAAAAGLDPFAHGFPDFHDYIEELFGIPQRRSAPHRDSDPHDEPDQAPRGRSEVTTAPPPPPPVVASSDCESLVELTPEQALQGERVEIDLPDGTAVEVWTPAMAGDGWRLRLAGVAPGGADHFLQLRVRTPEGLRVDGLRVLYQLDLSPAEGALGCSVVVPTLDGPVQLRIPPGSSSGRLLRLRGRGLQQGEQRGDQLVEVRLVVPSALTEAEEALYARLQQLAAELDGERS